MAKLASYFTTPVSPSLERVRERVGSRTKAYVSSIVNSYPSSPGQSHLNEVLDMGLWVNLRERVTHGE